MCIKCVREEKPKARKDYRCDACEWILNDLKTVIDELTFAEKRSIVKAKRNNWKIKKGETYIRQFNKDGGDVFTFKAIPAIHQICIDHEWYCD